MMRRSGVSLPSLLAAMLCGPWSAAGGPAPIPYVGGEDACGRNCLYVALRSLGAEPASPAEIEERIGRPPVGGYHLKRLKEGAETYGMHTLGVRTSLDNLARRPRPFACIAHYTSGHFVLVTDIVAQGRGVRVIDPPKTAVELPKETFETLWSGNALLISPVPLIAEEELPRDFPWRSVLVSLAALLGIGVLGLLWRKFRWVPAACVGLIITGCNGHPAPANPEPAARPAVPFIAVDEPDRDLGNVSVSAQLPDILYVVKNRGEATLVLFGAETSCSCAESEISRTEIPPGEEAELRLTVRPGEPGQRTASVALHSNDPSRRVVNLGVKWNAIAPIDLSVRNVDLGTITQGETGAQKVSLIINDPQSAGSVESVICHPSGAVRATPISETDWLIEVIGQGARQKQGGSVTFRLHESWTDSLVLGLNWKVAHVIACTPERAFLGVGEPGSESEKAVMITLDEKRLMPERLRHRFVKEVPGLSAEVLPAAGGSEQTLMITWIRPGEPGVMTSEVELIGRGIDGTDMMTVLPVSGLIRQPEPDATVPP